METSGFRPAPDQFSHVPQQSRRDKLRVQPQVSVLQSNSHHLNLPNNLDQFTLHPDHNNSNNNINVHHVRNSGRHAANFLYDPASEMLDFSRLRNSVEACQDHNSEWRFSQLNPTPPYQSFDWSTTNFASASNLINPSSSDHHLINSGQKYLDPMNILQDHDNNVVTVAYAGTRRNQQDMDQKYSTNNVSNVRGDHHDPDDDHDQNELALLPLSFVNQSTTATLRFGELNNVDNHHHHHDHHHGGLSLSLSSINPGQFQGSSSARTSEIDLPLNNTNSNEPVVIPKPSIISKANCCGKSLQDIVGVSSGGYRSTTGPLGPFTGYATILKSSRFLRPAQQLLDEFCGSKVNTIINTSTTSTFDYQDHNSQRDVDVSGEMSGSANSGDNNNIGVNVNELSEVMAKKVSNNSNINININNNNNSCASSSTFYGSNEISTGDHQHGGFGSNNLCFGSSRPEPAQQKKAKLLYMQEEVSRKYKQYRQQMQMVVSSFESVAGLSSATPYISLALRAVARHFRCLKSAIADQLKHTRKALGEDLPSPTTGSCSKGAADHAMSTVRLKYMEQSFQKHKSGGANLAFPEPQQHIWRPQRGLPERSVAILRAWLFEHFLHPYPTDTDKHMLATQTGLTRNQVSNWFINARVRVWKPMVEEIHSLETKGLAEQVDKNPGNNEANQASNDQAATKVGTNVMLSKPLELPGTGYTAGNRDHRLSSADQQSQEKRLRTLECQVPTSMTGALMGFVPYHRSGLEVWSRAHQ